MACCVAVARDAQMGDRSGFHGAKEPDESLVGVSGVVQLAADPRQCLRDPLDAAPLDAALYEVRAEKTSS